jgi:hypothetical protein
MSQYFSVSLVCHVNCSWPSPAQSVLVLGPLEPVTVFLLFPSLVWFEMGPPLRLEEGSDCYWSLPLCWSWLERALTRSLTGPFLHTHTYTHSLSPIFFSISHWSSLYNSGRGHIGNNISNNSSVVECVSIPMGMCLPSHYVAVAVSFGSTIPTFRRNVTIYFRNVKVCNFQGEIEKRKSWLERGFLSLELELFLGAYFCFVRLPHKLPDPPQS